MRCLKAEGGNCQGGAQLHEIYYGSADRQTAIKYNLRMPLCMKHHNEMHNNKRAGQLFFCATTKISYDVLNLIMNKPPRYWNCMQKMQMEHIKNTMTGYLKKWGVNGISK